jgi:uncharacterized protein YjbI with pentapeptide repeats
MKFNWRKLLVVFGFSLIVLILLYLIIRTSFTNGTGFFDFIDQKGNFHLGKTLWDWMELLIIPLSISIGVIIFNYLEKRNELNLEKEKMRGEVLYEYINSMTKMILDESFSGYSSLKQITIARIKTLTALRMLDGDRKGILINFLFEAGLIGGVEEEVESNRGISVYKEAIISLRGADLSYAFLTGDYRYEIPNPRMGNQNFEGHELWGIDLSGSNLSFAILDKVDLTDSKLVSANCRNASFINCRCVNTNFSNANCTGANFQQANFQNADFSNANLENANLSRSNIFSSRFVHYYNPNPEGFSQKTNLKGANLKEADTLDCFIIPTQIKETKNHKKLILPNGYYSSKYSLINIKVTPYKYTDESGNVIGYGRSPDISFRCRCGMEINPFVSNSMDVYEPDDILKNLWTVISLHIKEHHPKYDKLSEIARIMGYE